MVWTRPPIWMDGPRPLPNFRAVTVKPHAETSGVVIVSGRRGDCEGEGRSLLKLLESRQKLNNVDREYIDSTLQLQTVEFFSVGMSSHPLRRRFRRTQRNAAGGMLQRPSTRAVRVQWVESC